MGKKDTVKVELNLAGLNELMKSAEMQQRVNEAVQRVQQAAGDDYEGEVRVGSFDTIGIVSSKGEAKLDDANALLKAIGKAGLPLHK